MSDGGRRQGGDPGNRVRPWATRQRAARPFDTGPGGHWMPPTAPVDQAGGDETSPWAPAAPAGPPPVPPGAWAPAQAPDPAGPAGPGGPAPGPEPRPGQRPGRRRKRLAIAGLVVAVLVAGGAGAVWLLGGGGDAERDGGGEIVAGGDLSAFSFREGDCWNDPPLDREVETVAAVPCAEPHDAEVYAVYDLELDGYPGDDEVAAAAEAGCVERFAEFAGVEYAASELEVVFLNPTQESWNAEDDRSVVCSASDPAAPTTGSLRSAAR